MYFSCVHIKKNNILIKKLVLFKISLVFVIFYKENMRFFIFCQLTVEQLFDKLLVQTKHPNLRKEEMHMNWVAVVWFALMIFFIFLEASTVSLVSTWFAVGALGEVLPYRWVAAMFAGFSFAAIVVLIVRNKKLVEPVYNFHV